MVKNSILYRRMWYAKRRNGRNLHIYSRLLIVIILFVLLVTYVQRQAFPYLAQISECKTRETLSAIMNEAVARISYSSFSYDRLATVIRDEVGNISSIQVNSSETNKIAVQTANYIQRRLSALPEETLALPLGILSGKTIFSGLGPKIHIRYNVYGNVNTRVVSTLTKAGPDQTRHQIILHVQMQMAVYIPLMKRQVEIDTEIPLTDSVIAGNVPE